MPKAKKKKSKEECSAQYARTVKRTGKWRGKNPTEYKKYTSKKNKKTRYRKCA